MAKLDLIVNVVSKGTDKLNNIGKNLSVGVTLPLVAAGGAFANMAAEAEQTQAKLESVFDSTGAAAWTSVDALNAHATALSEATTFDDDAVKEAQAKLLAFGDITGAQFEGATDAAADLAAFLGTDIPSAAASIGKALSDPEAGLGRLSKAIGGLTDEQQASIDKMVEAGDMAGAQQAILDAVSGKIGTVAEDLAATSGGQMAQAMNQLGEAGESIGVFLLPVLTTLAGGLKAVAGWFQSLSPAAQGWIVKIAAVAAAIGPLILIGSKLVGGFRAIIGAFQLLRVVMLANPFVALATAIAAIAVLVITNWDKIVEVFKGAMKFLKETGEKLWKPIGEGFKAAIDFIKGVWNTFVRFWNSIQVSVPSIDIPLVGKVGGFTIGLPDLPMLASGGIVNDPTLAIIGEKGPEAVVPLDKMPANQTTIEVTVLGDLKAEDEKSLADAIGRVWWANGFSDAVTTNG